MCSGVVKKKEGGLDEEGLCEGHAHTPSTRHVLCFLLYGFLVEAETGENEGGSHLEGGGVHAFDTLQIVNPRSLNC